MTPAPARTPARFSQRTLAWCLDWLLLLPVLGWLAAPPLRRAWQALLALFAGLQQWLLDRLLGGATLVDLQGLAQSLLADPAQRASAEAQLAVVVGGVTLALLWASIAATLYFAGFEAGPWQATPGKRLLGLRVETVDGGKPGLARALLRYLGGALSWLTLNIGHAMVAWRRDGRALHDLVAGTRVSAAGPMPAWGRWALVALMLGALALLAWGGLRLVGAASLPGV